LKLEYDAPPLNFAFTLNLRHYNKQASLEQQQQEMLGDKAAALEAAAAQSANELAAAAEDKAASLQSLEGAMTQQASEVGLARYRP